jgi:hypothetical protein
MQTLGDLEAYPQPYHMDNYQDLAFELSLFPSRNASVIQTSLNASSKMRTQETGYVFRQSCNRLQTQQKQEIHEPKLGEHEIRNTDQVPSKPWVRLSMVTDSNAKSTLVLVSSEDRRAGSLVATR